MVRSFAEIVRRQRGERVERNPVGIAVSVAQGIRVGPYATQVVRVGGKRFAAVRRREAAGRRDGTRRPIDRRRRHGELDDFAVPER